MAIIAKRELWFYAGVDDRRGPLMKVEGLAEGQADKREQELMVISEAIAAHTDPALDADVHRAAEHMLLVLDYCEQSLPNFADMGLFLYYVCIENLGETMRGWAPYHFLLMLEALHAARRRAADRGLADGSRHQESL